MGNVFRALIFNKNIRICFNKFDYFCQKEQFSVCIIFNLSKGFITWNFSVLKSSSRSVLTGWGVQPAMAHKVFGTDSSFRVKWRTTGRLKLLFFKSFLLVLAKLSFWQGAGRWASILWGFGTVLIFSNFLKS